MVAYAGFDQVLVGLAFTVIMLFTAVLVFILSRHNYRTVPFTFYTIIAYTLGLVGAIAARLL